MSILLCHAVNASPARTESESLLDPNSKFSHEVERVSIVSSDPLLPFLMTTGTFTVEAKKEARRDGAAPIELVAGEDLVKLFEDLELGLLPRRTFEVDRKFFDEFAKDA